MSCALIGYSPNRRPLLLIKHVLLYIPGFLKTGLAKIRAHSSNWQLKTIKFVQMPIESLYLWPGIK